MAFFLNWGQGGGDPGRLRPGTVGTARYQGQRDLARDFSQGGVEGLMGVGLLESKGGRYRKGKMESTVAVNTVMEMIQCAHPPPCSH